MDRQNIFNTVVAHARKQNAKAEDMGTCKYKGPDGLKCFIGCLIPDPLYYPIIEGSSLRVMHKDFILPSDKVREDKITTTKVFQAILDHLGVEEDKKDLNFLISLQNIHDDHEPIYWETRFKDFAHLNSLTSIPL